MNPGSCESMKRDSNTGKHSASKLKHFCARPRCDEHRPSANARHALRQPMHDICGSATQSGRQPNVRQPQVNRTHQTPAAVTRRQAWRASAPASARARG
eukprot:15431677-Alexandrium_andersonii.AAC.1